MGNDRKAAVVLSGGGAKGAFQAGALEVLNENGYTFDFISGVSVGALNGAMLATDQFPQLIEIWKNVKERDVLKRRGLVSVASQFIRYKIGLGKPPKAVNSNRPLKRLMEEQLLDKKVDRPFHFGFVVLDTGDFVNAVVRSGDHAINRQDIERILASTAIPVIYDPVIGPNGKTWVDGGVRNITPIGQILPYNPDEIVIIPTEPFKAKEKEEEVPLDDIVQILQRTIDVMLEEIFRNDIRQCLLINRLVKQAAEDGTTLTKPNGTPYKYYEVTLIDPEKELGSDQDFSRGKLDERFRMGRERAAEMLRNG
ncbi:MAG: patatin-like phospholipase family protein [Balneolaceae bacterium]|nr:patatin-like phospholipase family protein [Balneolaceae bacterium]